jgi:hypothetical protein
MAPSISKGIYIYVHSGYQLTKSLPSVPMYFQNHIFQENVKKNLSTLLCNHISLPCFLNGKNFQLPPHSTILQAQILRNYAHVYFLCTPMDHICGVPTSPPKKAFSVCTSNIFSHTISHDPCYRRSNQILLEYYYYLYILITSNYFTLFHLLMSQFCIMLVHILTKI